MAPASEPAPPPLIVQFPFRRLETRASDWTPDQAAVTLNARTDARLVPSPASPDGMRLSYAHLVVLDGFFGEPERAALLDHLTAPGWDHAQGPPPDKWERETADGAGCARTWGLRDGVLRSLLRRPPAAVLEVHARLAALYPEYDIAHMPAELMQAGSLPQDERPGGEGVCPARGQHCQENNVHAAAAEAVQLRPGSNGRGDGGHTAPRQGGHQRQEQEQREPAVFCAQFVGNAAVAGDQYSYHVDADPADLPPSPWVDAFGAYCNGEPGRPLLVSLLLYLCDAWPRDWAAETLFLDAETDVGVVVRPKRYRAVLMDQDMLHRVSAPSLAAGGRPRYSLVWKLAFVPRQPGQRACIARKEWGTPASIGSAQKVQAAIRRMGK